MNMLASVIGATGQTGKHIVKKLIEKKYSCSSVKPKSIIGKG